MSQNPSEKGSNQEQTENMYSYNDGPKNEISQNIVESQAIRRSQGGNDTFNNKENNNIKDSNNINNINIPSYKEDNNINNNKFKDYNYNSNFNFRGSLNNSRTSIIHIESNPSYLWVIFLAFIIIQFAFIIVFGFYYLWDSKFNHPKNKGNNEPAKLDIKQKYASFQDMTVLILLGFGFLRSFLKHHSWSGITFTFMGAIFSFEFGLICLITWNSLIRKDWIDGYYNFNYFFDGLYICASFVVSFGSYIGKLSFIQFFIVIIIETLFSTLNYILVRQSLKLIDIGGTLTVHLFGAVFGAAFSIIYYCNKNESERINTSIHLGYSHNSMLFALFGSLIIIPYWCSFNTALVTGNMKYRGIINTYFAIGGSIIGMFAISFLLNNKKIKVQDLLYASFPGAIVIGGCCHIIKQFYLSILFGIIASILCCLIVYIFYTKIDTVKKKYHDTAQILFYHGIPAILGGIVSAIFIGNLNNWKNIENFKYKMFIGTFQNTFENPSDYDGNINISGKAGAIFGAIFLTIFLGAFSGLLIGFSVKYCNCNMALRYFNDSEFFDTSENEPFPWSDERVEIKFDDKINQK